MIDARIDALIQMDLDGEISAEDARELDRVLASDAHARAHREELRNLQSKLAAVEPVAAPAHLKGVVLSRLPAGSAPSAASGESFWESIAAAFRSPRLGLAASFAAGALVALGALALAGRGSSPAFDPGDLAGTLIAEAPAVTETFAVGELTGTAGLELRDRYVLVSLDLDAPSLSQITIAPEGDRWRALGVRTGQGFQGDLGLSSAGWSLGHRGKHNYVFLFDPGSGDPRVRIDVRAAGGVESRWLTLDGSDR